MPSVLTHYGFNRQVLDNSIKFLNGNEDIYLLGAQGPDPFFFYGIVPFMKTNNPKEVRNYGSKLHKIDPKKEFEFFFEYANKSENKDVLYAYILGAGLHYVLDRKVHPYVFYKTGFSSDPKMKKKYFADHTLFETHLDVLLMNDYYKQYKTRTFDSILSSEEKVKEVSSMYFELAKETVKEEKIGDDSFYDCYKHMLKIEHLLYSKRGIKKFFAKLFVKGTPLNTMMHPLRVKDDVSVDYLNLKKNEWKDPSSETSYNKSLIELIEEARNDAREWTIIVKNAYEGKIDVGDFTREYIYDGNKINKEMKIFKSVYRKENEK